MALRSSSLTITSTVADISSRILLLEKGRLIKDLQNTDGAAIAELNEYFGIQAGKTSMPSRHKIHITFFLSLSLKVAL